MPPEFQCIKNNPSVVQELACSQYLHDRRFMILTFDHMILKNFGSWREHWKYLYKFWLKSLQWFTSYHVQQISISV